MKSKLASIILSLVLALALIVPAVAEGDLSEPGVYPIWTGEEPYVLKVLVATNAHVSDWDNNTFTKWVEEKCNVDLQFEFLPEVEPKQKLTIMLDTTFTWDKDGKVAESQSAGMKNTFTYDDRGLLLSCLTEVDTWEMSIYRYLEFDDHGNWTKRERQYIGLSSSAEEGEDPTYKGKDTEERVIKYY